MTDMITFLPKQNPSIIKVLGVGGGGSNAVNHMFKQGITGVDFAICNTDVQALESSPVPIKIEIGNKTGLGAGAKPEVGKAAAEESIDKIKELLSDDTTQMLFITAGMGGGTGTGAAPIIAKLAREMGILTVGIVTLPFGFEGRRRKQQAEIGIGELKQHVDALLVISNDKLREQFGNLVLGEAFGQADNVLANAAKGIAELITVTGYINVDFEDVRTVLKDSGKAIMGSAKAEGEDRAARAIEEAMNSPLLNDNEIAGATDILLYITTGIEDITMDEITEITDYVQKESGRDADTIWGVGKDESLGNNIGITIIATGFDKVIEEPKKEITKTIIGGVGKHSMPEPSNIPTPQIIRTPNASDIDDVKKVSDKVETIDKIESIEIKKPTTETTTSFKEESKIVHTLSEVEEKPIDKKDTPTNTQKTSPSSYIRHSEKPYLSLSHTVSSRINEPEPEIKEEVANDDDINKNAAERVNRLKGLSINLRSQEKVAAYENEPAYIRKQVQLDETDYSAESSISRYSLGEDSKSNPVIKSDNSFLHDNVD